MLVQLIIFETDIHICPFFSFSLQEQNGAETYKRFFLSNKEIKWLTFVLYFILNTFSLRIYDTI